MATEPTTNGELKHAIILPNWEVGADADLMVDYAVAAEEAGWDGVLLADHLVFPPQHSSAVARGGDLSPQRDPPQYRDFIDPWIAMAGIAARTNRIKLGSWVTPIPRRDPSQFARDLATLDRLSDGRVILGAGLGVRSEYEPLGKEWDLKTLGRKCDEALDVITGLWSGERVRFEGEHYIVDDVAVLPTPAQKPRIPIIIGGVWPNRKPFQRGARWDGIVPLFPGDGVIPGNGDEDPDLIVRDMLGYYHSLTDDPGDIFLPADVPGSSFEYRHVCREFGVTWLYTRPEGRIQEWSLDMQLVRNGPPT